MDVAFTDETWCLPMKLIVRLLSMPALLVACVHPSSAAAEVVIAPTEDVFTSGFFFPPGTPNAVQGFDSDVPLRNLLRVSSPAPFGIQNPEVIYLQFNPASFSSLGGSIRSARLTMTSVDGGFSANASATMPFLVSAHGVNSDPLSIILDDDNAGGFLTSFEYFQTQILAAPLQSRTVIDAIDQTFEFDVTSIVNSWLDGSNPNFYLAMTGSNDLSGTDFLHGFSNNSFTPGSTFLTVTAIPEPSGLGGLLVATSIIWARRRRADYC